MSLRSNSWEKRIFCILVKKQVQKGANLLNSVRLWLHGISTNRGIFSGYGWELEESKDTIVVEKLKKTLYKSSCTAGKLVLLVDKVLLGASGRRKRSNFQSQKTDNLVNSRAMEVYKTGKGFHDGLLCNLSKSVLSVKRAYVSVVLFLHFEFRK